MAENLADFIDAMRVACEDWDLGYDQSQRWNVYDGGECDCSSLVIWALGYAGFDTGGATYTGDMSDELCARGWVRLPAVIDDCRPGDILLNDEHHVCAVIDGEGWNATIAQASIDESGNAWGGEAGDQTGGETNTKGVYRYWAGWDCILRWKDAAPDDELELDSTLGTKSITKWQKQMGTKPDGVITGQRTEDARFWPQLVAIDGYDGSGSQLVKAVQTKIGVPHPTGVWARGSICLLQGWLVLHGYDIGHDEAGVLDKGTARGVQESLNDRAWS